MRETSAVVLVAFEEGFVGTKKLTGDSEDDGGKVESSDVRGEASCSTKMGEELSSWNVGEQHVDVDRVLIRLVAIPKGRSERMERNESA